MDAMDQVLISAMSVYLILKPTLILVIVNARLVGAVMTAASTKVDVIPCVNPKKVVPVRLRQTAISA